MGLVFYVSPHLIFWVICFYHILEKYQSVRGWKWRMLVLQKQFERNWLRSHSDSALQTECSSDGTAAAPQTGSWCRLLLYLRLLSFHCFCSLSEPPAFPLILPATWLLSHFIFSYTESVSRSATKSCGWHTLFGLLLLLYWQFLGLHFHTLKNQLWCPHLTSFPP